MKNIFSSTGLEVLQQFAWSNVLLGFDFDGTLAPIEPDPARAVLRTSTKALLRKLAGRYPCAVISGRSRADVGRRLGGTGIAVVLGNHGLEPGLAPAWAAKRVRSWRRLLDRRLASFPGVEIEDKGLSLAVHYRRSRAKKAVRQAIGEAALELSAVRVLGGKQVVNLVPEGAGHKGLALLRERDRAGCTTAIFVGDDDTDEDAFALAKAEPVLAVRIGRKPASLADYYLPRQADIDDLIRHLIIARGTRILARA